MKEQPGARPPGRDQAEARRARKAAYRWNTIAGLLFTAQSVVMLVVITRVCDIYAAGVFTIAFAVADLFRNVGMYGMRKFQASDRNHEFGFREYWASRVATCTAMIAASGAYIAYSSLTLGYPPDKTLVLCIMCLFKAVDVIEDVYSGAYQLQDRLDIGQKMVSIRQIATMAVFALALVAAGDLAIALCVTTAFTAVLLAAQVRYVRVRHGMPDLAAPFSGKRVLALLRQCFPLFAAAFLLFYIGSAPKYAIDAIMDDAVQAYYGYVSMPVFAVNILATFVYNPMVTELSDLWQKGEVRALLGRFARISAIICGLTAACVALAFLAGVPVLDLLYNTEVSAYLAELLVLVAGGGFLALATLANVGITIIRFQRVLVPLSLLMAVIAYLVAFLSVSGWGITGAAWAYFFTMLATALAFGAAFLVGCKAMRPHGKRVE